MTLDVKDAANVTRTITTLGDFAYVNAAFGARPTAGVQYSLDSAWNANTPAIITFAGMAALPGGGGEILQLHAMSSANQTSILSCAGEVWFFDGSVTLTADVDNTAFTITDAQMASVVAIVPFAIGTGGNPTVGATGNAIGISIPVQGFKCATGSTDLVAKVKITNAYTAVADEVLSFRALVKRY